MLNFKVSSIILDVGNLRSNIYGNLQWENFDRDGAYPIPFEYSSPLKRDIFSTVRSNPVVKYVVDVLCFKNFNSVLE